MSASDVFFNLLADSDPPSQATADAFIAQADALIAGYLTLPGVDRLPASPPPWTRPRGMLALVLYNRRGAEGEIKRAEGRCVVLVRVPARHHQDSAAPLPQRQGCRLAAGAGSLTSPVKVFVPPSPPRSLFPPEVLMSLRLRKGRLVSVVHKKTAPCVGASGSLYRLEFFQSDTFDGLLLPPQRRVT
ncbi:MAG: hypothetical protein ACOX62_03440 [Christensenellales bacterium]